LPVRKDAEEIFPADTGPGDRLNVAYSSSSVTKGRATGVVYATGMQTEIGRIAAALRKKDSKRRPVKRKPDGKAKPHRYAQAYALTTTDAIGRFLGVNVGTPLQQKLSKLAVLLFVIAVICAIICLAANQFSSKKEVVIYAVATGLSMIPASLIVVLTITMAAGTKRMVKRHVIVRNLKSLEALGAVTSKNAIVFRDSSRSLALANHSIADICSDKTGTLTQGKMVARQAWIPAKGTYSVQPSNEPFNPNTGGMSFSPSPPKDLKDSKDDESIETLEELQNNSNLEEWLKVASFANLATLHKTEEGWKTRGDPTEVAIQVFTHRFNHGREQFVSQPNPAWEEICEFPFDSDVKKMTIVMKNTSQGTYHVFTKGAVECVIDSCVTMTGKDETVTMTEEIQKNIIANMEALAAMGLRVLAFASYELEGDVELELEGKNEPDRKVFERDLVFRGLVGLYDPPRLESAQSVRQCQKAGISVHMLTGDHPTTARAIAIEVGILPSNQKMQHVRKDMADTMVTTAGQFDKLSDDEIDLLPILPLVIARCTPSTKVRMIEALHRRQRFVAMVSFQYSHILFAWNLIHNRPGMVSMTLRRSSAPTLALPWVKRALTSLKMLLI
jgi:Na+-exporting ATPase